MNKLSLEQIVKPAKLLVPIVGQRYVLSKMPNYDLAEFIIVYTGVGLGQAFTYDMAFQGLKEIL